MEEHFAWYKVNIPKQVTSKIYQTLVSGTKRRNQGCSIFTGETTNSDLV